MGTQALLHSFYDIDNLVTVSVSIPDAEWQALKTAKPAGGFGFIGSRYEWHKATSVSISGSKFPEYHGTFTNVGIIKKSYAGSFSTTKPAFRLDFTKYNPSNEDGVEALIGTQYMTLNNSIQDPAYVRQPLGYELLKQAGVFNFRCNFAKVIVNNINMGVYINIQPLKKAFVQRHFAGNDRGNAYEIELGEDFTTATMNSGRISFEGFSDFEDKKDLKLATETILHGGFGPMQQVVDLDLFISFFAMESLLKHWDGYTQNTNNTYIYNDRVAVANPSVSANNVKFKFIPSGIDQILQPNRNFVIGNQAVLAKLVNSPTTAQALVYKRIREYANGLFSQEKVEGEFIPLLNRMSALLTSAGVNVAGQVDIVQQQMRQVREAALHVVGEQH
jgi:hypothetical protein